MDQSDGNNGKFEIADVIALPVEVDDGSSTFLIVYACGNQVRFADSSILPIEPIDSRPVKRLVARCRHGADDAHVVYCCGAMFFAAIRILPNCDRVVQHCGVIRLNTWCYDMASYGHNTVFCYEMDNTVSEIDTERGAVVRSVKGHASVQLYAASICQFSDVAETFLCLGGTAFHDILIWSIAISDESLKIGETIRIANAHRGAIFHLSVDPTTLMTTESVTLVSCGDDRVVTMHKVDVLHSTSGAVNFCNPQRGVEMTLHTSRPWRACVERQRETFSWNVVSCGEDGKIITFNVSDNNYKAFTVSPRVILCKKRAYGAFSSICVVSEGRGSDVAWCGARSGALIKVQLVDTPAVVSTTLEPTKCSGKRWFSRVALSAFPRSSSECFKIVCWAVDNCDVVYLFVLEIISETINLILEREVFHLPKRNKSMVVLSSRYALPQEKIVSCAVLQSYSDECGCVQSATTALFFNTETFEVMIVESPNSDRRARLQYALESTREYVWEFLIVFFDEKESNSHAVVSRFVRIDGEVVFDSQVVVPHCDSLLRTGHRWITAAISVPSGYLFGDSGGHLHLATIDSDRKFTSWDFYQSIMGEKGVYKIVRVGNRLAVLGDSDEVKYFSIDGRYRELTTPGLGNPLASVEYMVDIDRGGCEIMCGFWGETFVVDGCGMSEYRLNIGGRRQAFSTSISHVADSLNVIITLARIDKGRLHVSSIVKSSKTVVEKTKAWHTAKVTSCAVARPLWGPVLVTTSEDGYLALWDEAFCPIAALKHDGELRTSSLLSCRSDDVVRVLSGGAKCEMSYVEATQGSVFLVARSRPGEIGLCAGTSVSVINVTLMSSDNDSKQRFVAITSINVVMDGIIETKGSSCGRIFCLRQVDMSSLCSGAILDFLLPSGCVDQLCNGLISTTTGEVFSLDLTQFPSAGDASFMRLAYDAGCAVNAVFVAGLEGQSSSSQLVVLGCDDGVIVLFDGGQDATLSSWRKIESRTGHYSQVTGMSKVPLPGRISIVTIATDQSMVWWECTPTRLLLLGRFISPLPDPYCITAYADNITGKETLDTFSVYIASCGVQKVRLPQI